MSELLVVEVFLFSLYVNNTNLFSKLEVILRNSHVCYVVTVLPLHLLHPHPRCPNISPVGLLCIVSLFVCHLKIPLVNDFSLNSLGSRNFF